MYAALPTLLNGWSMPPRMIASNNAFGNKAHSRLKCNRKFSSPNYSLRTKKIEYIITHFTDMTFQEGLERLCDPNFQVSSHFLIREDGEIFQLVDPYYKAWHAGVSSWHGIENLNESSIGIEMDNLGIGEFTEQQMSSLLKLCEELIAQCDISRCNILGHSDVAPTRKIDPGIFFDWRYLAEHNLGKWHNVEIPETSKVIFSFGDGNDSILIMQEALRKLGYKIEITGIFDWQTNCVVRAFQAKYNPSIIHKRGISYYRDQQSVYDWDECSQQILESLLS